MDVSAFVDGAIRYFPPPDQAVMRDPIFRPAIEQSQTVAWANGIGGVLADYNTTTPLTFQMSQVQQHVDLFHGTADTIVDPQPGCQRRPSSIVRPVSQRRVTSDHSRLRGWPRGSPR